MAEKETPTPCNEPVRTQLTASKVDEAIMMKTDLGKFGWPILIQVLFYAMRISGEPSLCRQVLALLSDSLNHKYILTAGNDTARSITSKIYIERRDRRLQYIPIRDQKFPIEGEVEDAHERRGGSDGTIPKVETSTSPASTISNETSSSKETQSICREYKGVKYYFTKKTTQLVLEILEKHGRRMRRIEILEELKFLSNRYDIPKDTNRIVTRASNKLVKLGIAIREAEGRKTYYSLAYLREEL